MRLPHQLLDSQFFAFDSEADFFASISGAVKDNELERIKRLVGEGLAPVTSHEVLATLIGVNAGIIWSFVNRPERHYRTFVVKKGDGFRSITAPRIGLKIIQKWLSVQLQKRCTIPDHVYGFVPGRSHIDAAKCHTNASWVYSLDIANFFPSTPKKSVVSSLASIGYDDKSAELIASLCCYRGFLAQGAPSSPVLSNLCMSGIDGKLLMLSEEFGVRVTRYADDITFSSPDPFPEALEEKALNLFQGSAWEISDEKTKLVKLPHRLKVHGLLVHGEKARLTKGYRNKIRAYQHMIDSHKCSEKDLPKLRGHLMFSDQVKKQTK